MNNELVLWDWEKKKRTMMRFIKAGDIFSFEYDEKTFCFGRIISRIVNFATIAEIFDYISNKPVISKEYIKNANRMFPPVNLNVYTLFDRKMDSEWRIIGHQESFIPKDANDILFTFGDCTIKKIDIWGNTTVITSEEAEGLLDFAYMGEFHIKELIKANLK